MVSIRTALAAGVLGLLTACGSSSAPEAGAVIPPPSDGSTRPPTFEGPVAKAACGVDDRVETGLQGQVAQVDRLSGRSLQGYNCNLERVGHFDNDGEGAGWQFAWFEDCGYMGTAKVPSGIGNTGTRPQQMHPGVQVINVADPTNPERTVALTSLAMLDPWESLKVNERRQLLADVDSAGGGGSAQFDIYDISGDCKQPQLLSSTPIGTSVGHAGHFAPDGMTYYGSPITDGVIKAIDIADPRNPRLITETFPLGTHDLSISQDGNRAYLAQNSGNGLAILDISEIQARKENPQARIISELYWPDGSTAQMTQRVTIGGTPYILFVDELGKGAARLIDISDEARPFIASKLKLDVHMPENAEAVSNDAGSGIFGYEGHYCTASDGINDSTTYDVENAVIAACSYFESGLRVFDIRNPYAPREIAYYNPPIEPGPKAGSYYNLAGNCTNIDWASAHPRVRPDRDEIWFTSQCGGLHVIKFTTPLKELLGEPPGASPPAASTGDEESRFGGALTPLALLWLGLAARLRRRNR
jgi:hypothetical protein